ncbi:plasmid stabilization protein [Melaminivora suipulveris]|uniref:Plasmid stabilization protein n=1 Tax=Melaminivora suipulveris TaxID=2109913 RepID=A0A2R3QFC1_9BURK|nr:type II toxin-antitoxin system RelE/ParE family toxin [Melaminivora suipulveris]AVO50478.1 plasmid stabilization protein [Melaminivora suipulveris]
MYSIEFTRPALKALARMPADARNLVKSRLEALAVAPEQAPNVKKLQGRPGYRLRVGDWRVIYVLESERLVVLVLDIGARGGIYR